MAAAKLIIIGSGPAGLTAAIYASRANLSPILFEGEPTGPGDQPGGQLMNTTEIENYPGVLELQGPELMGKMREQALKFDTKIVNAKVSRVDLTKQPFTLTAAGVDYEAQTIVVATGAKPLMLGLDDEWRLMGRGVSACATCDGFFFKDKDIAVVGGGDSAMEEATFLTRFAKSVTIIHRRDQFRASHAMIERAKADPKIKFHFNATVSQIHGQDKLEGLTLTDTKDGSSTKLDIQGLFVAIGHVPNSDIFKDQLEMDEKGYIVTHGAKTSVPGVFAAGDVQDHVYRQAITSAGTGCMAALDAQHFLENVTAAVV